MEIDFEWSPVQEKWTKAGRRWYRQALLKPEWIDGFWLFWKKNVIKLRQEGYSVFKSPDSGKWYFTQWSINKSDFDKGKTKPKRPAIILESCLVNKPLKFTDGLKEWQVPLAERIIASLSKWDAALDGSDTGAGKTYVAASVARDLGFKIGVICPLAVTEAWRRVIQNHFGMEFHFIRNYESLRTGKYDEIVKWGKVKTKSGWTRPQFIWKCPAKTLLIFDEAHKCKGRDTKNSKLMRTAKAQGYKILACSATSAINPLELRALGFALGLHKDKDFSEWLEDNGCQRGRFGYEFNGDKYVLKKLHKDILLDRGVRITREEIPDFPECDTKSVAYNVGKDSEISIKNIYEDMKKELALYEKKKGNIKGENELIIQLRARQKAELIKVPLFVDLAQESIEDGLSVVIFLNFRDTITAVAERLGTDCILWGDNKGGERQKFIDLFQDDKSRIIIVSVQAGGAGLSLHDLNGKFPRMSIISPSFSAVDIKQVLGRIHRVGGKTKAMQRLIYCANTVEEDVCNSIQQKLQNLDLLNDGDLQPHTKKLFEKS